MHIAASTRSLWDLAFPAACLQIQELGFDKVEIWLNEEYDQLRPSRVAADPEGCSGLMREASRLTPNAIFLESEVDIETFKGIVKFAKLQRIVQITIQSSIATKTGTLTEDPHTAVELCQSVKGLGITLDPSYYICRPGSPLNYDRVYEHAQHLHLRDTSATELQVLAGLGSVDYNHIVQMLRQTGFQRTLSVDLLPRTMSGEERLREMRKLRLLLTSLL